MAVRKYPLVRTTISITHDIKRRMDRADKVHSVNWSAVCRDAIVQHLIELEGNGDLMSMNRAYRAALARIRDVTVGESADACKTAHKSAVEALREF